MDAVEDEAGDAVKIFGTGQDITKRKPTDTVLRKDN
jgi:hypothetical protein